MAAASHRTTQTPRRKRKDKTGKDRKRKRRISEGANFTFHVYHACAHTKNAPLCPPPGTAVVRQKLSVEVAPPQLPPETPRPHAQINCRSHHVPPFPALVFPPALPMFCHWVLPRHCYRRFTTREVSLAEILWNVCVEGTAKKPRTPPTTSFPPPPPSLLLR